MFGNVQAVAMRDGDSGPAPGAKLARFAATALLLLELGFLPHAEASVARAGTVISNTAEVSYDLDGVRHAALTNTASFRVDELVSFDIVDVASDVAGEARFAVRNTGNGCEALMLSAFLSDGASAAIAIDTDGDGAFDPARDAVYAPGEAPTLCPDDSVLVFVVISAGAARRAGDTMVTINVDGQGAGDGGGDVVTVGGASRSRPVVMPAAEALRVALLKSQSVIGQPAAVRVEAGDVIAYTLRISATGEGLVEDAVLSDPLPAGLAYVPGSLTIDGQPLDDGADARLVTIRLPPTAAPFDRVIAFRARVLAQ